MSVEVCLRFGAFFFVFEVFGLVCYVYGLVLQPFYFGLVLFFCG